MNENKYIKGAFLSAPRENAPTFIKGNISIKVEEFIKYLNENKNSAGYVNIDLKESREGKLYIQLNEYKPKTQESNEVNIE